MPKQYSRKRSAGDEYEADCGFVEDAPKSKKTKAATSKSNAKSQDSEPQYWGLGSKGTRRVQLNEFKGVQLVDIREFYEKDEEMLPGKKGISLSIEQFTTLLEQLPAIERALKAKGISVPRPRYGSSSANQVDEDEEEGEEKNEDEDAEEPDKEAVADASDEEEPVKSKPVKAGRLDKFKHKANHEATSEEDN
ncbi:hypothetical protein MBLNU13_g08582t1 [Cladosporium sp. NU13]